MKRLGFLSSEDQMITRGSADVGMSQFDICSRKSNPTLVTSGLRRDRICYSVTPRQTWHFLTEVRGIDTVEGREFLHLLSYPRTSYLSCWIRSWDGMPADFSENCLNFCQLSGCSLECIKATSSQNYFISPCMISE